MNERIRELAEQAYKEVVETNDYNGGAYTVREFDKEKFAELIVRECASITLDYKNDWHYHGWLDYRAEILEHFGVER